MIIIDELDYRLEFAKNYAKCEAYNFRSMADPVLFIKKITDFLGADVCIDAVGAEATGSAFHSITGRKLLLQAGSPTALNWAINSVKKGGVVSIVGVYGPTGNLIPIGNVINKGITIRANQASVKRLLPRLIEHVQSGVLNPKALITHRIPLEDVADAYRIFSDKLDHCIKPVLITSSVSNSLTKPASTKTSIPNQPLTKSSSPDSPGSKHQSSKHQSSKNLEEPANGKFH